MDFSFSMLSSMSPKVNKNHNPYLQRKVPTLLALKKNVRRSSNFDSVCPPARLRQSVVLIESSTESTNSLESDKNVLNQTPIIIPDSDDEKIETNEHLSQTKLVTIKDWVQSVNAQKFDVVKEKTEINSNTSLSELYNFEDVLNSLPKNSQDCVSDSSSGSEIYDSPNQFHTEILNELYCDKWKILKDELLPKSTPRKKIQNPNVIGSKTDVKSKLFRNNPKVPNSPWYDTLKKLCDRDTSDDDSTTKAPVKPAYKLNFNLDEDDLSSLSSRSSSRKKNSCKDNNSDLSDKSKNDVKTKPQKPLPKAKTKEGGNEKGKTAVRQKDNKSTKVKSKSTDHDKRESLSIGRHITDGCVWTVTPIKEKPNKSNTVKSFLASLSGSVPLSQCDPAARLFRNNFKGYKDELLNRLFKLYNEEVFDNKIPEDTLFEWNDRMRGTAGFCYCRKVTRRTGIIERKARIVLSTKVLDSCDRLRDTLIHELCHAATWIINEVANGHGDYWRAWAAKALRRFPELPPIKRCHDYIINTKYTYRCMDCGYSIGRHSKSLDIERKRCGYCYGKFEVLLNKVNKGGETKSVPVASKKTLTGFALFVKENYAAYKTPELNHAQVMKLLGQKFNEAKVPL